MLTSHPIQYQAPLWREMAKALHFDRDNFDNLKNGGDEHGGGAERSRRHTAEGKRPELEFEVWFLTDQGVRRTEDRDFGKAFAWDVDLLSGYPHRFLELRGKWDMRKFNGIPLARPIGESLREAGATALWVEGWRFKPFWDAVSAAKKMGIPVFLRGETSDKIAEKRGLFGLVRNFALHRLFAKVDYFLAIGQASRRFYLKHGVPAGKLIDAPYGVDNEFFRAEAGKIRGRSAYAFAVANESRLCCATAGQAGVTREGSARSAHFERDNFDILKEKAGLRHEATSGGDFAGQQDLRLTDLKLETPADIRRAWGIPLDAKVVMFCGKFVRKKRPLDVALAAQAHFDRYNFDILKGGGRPAKKWHLLFVGSGEVGDELRAACDVRFDAEGAQFADQRTKGLRDEGTSEARGKGCEARGERAKDPRQGETSSLEPRASSHARSDARPPASFAGFLNQSEISRAYAVADVVVLPSEAWETWGLVVNEATAAGVPTVVSDRCGCSEDFAAKNPYTRVYPMGDVAALAAAIEEVLALEAKPEDVTKYAEAFAPRITAEAVAGRLRAARQRD